MQRGKDSEDVACVLDGSLLVALFIVVVVVAVAKNERASETMVRATFDHELAAKTGDVSLSVLVLDRHRRQIRGAFRPHLSPHTCHHTRFEERHQREEARCMDTG